MAANDITVSAAGSSTSIKVHQITSAGDTRQPTAADPVTIAASGSAVFNLGVGDALIIERIDSTVKAAENHRDIRVRKDFK